jgi:ATP-binding cassette, subfamily B, multidrug efflux pump
VQSEDDKPVKVYDAQLARRLGEYVRPYWIAVALSVVFLMGSALLQTAGPWLTQVAIDRYLSPDPKAGPSWIDAYLPAASHDGMLLITFFYIGAIVLGLGFSFGQAYFMNWTGQHAMFDLRRNLIAHLQRVDMVYFDRTPVGRILTRVTSDVDQLNELFTSGVVAILADLAVITFLLIAMFRMSPALTLIILAGLPIAFWMTNIFRNQVRVSNRRVRAAVARINTYLQEHLSGIAVVQLFNREVRSEREFDSHNAEHMIAYKDAIFAYAWFFPAVETVSTVGLAALLVFGGWRISSGELTLGVLVAFFQYGMRFFRPIQDLSEKYSILQTAMAAGERVFEMLDTQPHLVSPARPAARPARNSAIEFKNVWFAYKTSEDPSAAPDWVLKDLSFRIEPGETIAVVGHTGAGKTTLTNLLLRFYDIQRGSITVGGVDLRQFDPLDLRRHFGIVLQDPFLFTGDLASNIRLGTEGIDDSRIREASQRVNLDDFVETLPARYAHEVRERGAGLSTGQKQLVSFARALAHDPPFLILDEATSSVDTETEMTIRDALSHMITGRTSIVIAHRLSTIQTASRIFVMHKGQLRESGTHQQLLAERGIYWRLYRLQYKDQEAA